MISKTPDPFGAKDRAEARRKARPRPIEESAAVKPKPKRRPVDYTPTPQDPEERAFGVRGRVVTGGSDPYDPPTGGFSGEKR